MVQTAASAIDALLGSNISGAINGFRNDLSSWVDSTFGENAVQIKRMANLDVGTTMKQWGSYGASLGSKLDNLNLNVSDLAGSFGDLDLGDGAGRSHKDRRFPDRQRILRSVYQYPNRPSPTGWRLERTKFGKPNIVAIYFSLL